VNKKTRKNSVLQRGKAVWQEFTEDRGLLLAAAIAFYMTLSMIPLLLLMVSVAAFFISPAQAQSIGANLTARFGAGIGGAIRDQVLSVVQNRGALTGISLLVGFWAGSQVFVIIQVALNAIWEVDERRPLWVRRGLALAMVIVVGIIVLLAVAVNFLITALGHLNIPILGFELGSIPWFITILFNFVLPWLLITLAFLIIYRFLSARKVTWRMALPGAIIAGFIWTILLLIFSWYTANFANYSVLYGSLGGLVLLMLWFNYSAMILLLGAEISSVLYRDRGEAQDIKK